MSKRWSVEFRTPKQIDAVDWAFWGTDEGHDDLYSEQEVAVERATWDGRVLTGCANTIADILYRLEEQLQDMSYEENGRPEVAALNAAKLIRKATGVDHDGFGVPTATNEKESLT